MKNQPLHPHTAVINLKQKNISKAKRQHALKWLSLRFPHLFDNHTMIKPLKVGIMQDLLAYAKAAEAEGISVSKLREALVLHTRKIEYLACLKAREMRYDLENQPTTQVTYEEAENATQKLRKRIEKTNKRSRALTPQASSYAPAPSYEAPSMAEAALERKVNIKHKTSRPYDATAVARLKEKLGLKKQKVSDASQTTASDA